MANSGQQSLDNLVNDLLNRGALGVNQYPIVLGIVVPLLCLPRLLTTEQLRVSLVLATRFSGQSTTGVGSRTLPRLCKHIRAFQSYYLASGLFRLTGNAHASCTVNYATSRVEGKFQGIA
jgi:hypothetical protein